jgi:hypothetical protein
MSETFWNYEPTPCRIVRVVVGRSPRPSWWSASLAGTIREAVEVNYHGEVFYLDNPGVPAINPGEGWRKVTEGRGGPDWPHSEIPNARVIEDGGKDG